MTTNERINVTVNNLHGTKNKTLCLARIDDYWNLLKRVTIGESVTSSKIELTFNDSIGRSKWMLIFFPKGQYVHGLGNRQVTIYLKMISCDHPDRRLAANLKFYIKSPYQMEDLFASTKKVFFNYLDVSERWHGFDLVKVEQLYSKDCEYLFLNKTLTIGCELIVLGDSERLKPRIGSHEVSIKHFRTDLTRNANNKQGKTLSGDKKLNNNTAPRKENVKLNQQIAGFFNKT